MHKALFRKELMNVLLLSLALAIILKAVFYKESLLVVLRLSVGITYLFVLPGFCAMYYWADKLDFTERIIIGTALAFAFNGIFGYYLGIIGVHTKYHWIILPPLLILIGMAHVLRKENPSPGSAVTEAH